MRRMAGFKVRARVSLACVVALSAAFAPPEVEAYTPSISSAGKPIRWHGSPKLNLAGNPRNRSGLPGSYFFDAVVRGLQRWKAASEGVLDFDYWQGTDPSVYEPNSEYNGLSSVYFISEDNSGFTMDPGVIGLTQVWYELDTGKILEIDIAFNDVDYVFTSNPADTSGSGNGGSGGYAGNRVYLENVLTHELGHAMGLSHGGSLQSTMLFVEGPEQARLSCDDIAGVRAAYPSGRGQDPGAIKGRVLSPEGVPVVGAHVVAISRSRGTVLSSALSKSDGSFRVAALEPGTYHLLVEPFYAGSGSLPAYYSDMNPAVCPGGSFSRTFVQAEGGYRLRNYSVSKGATANAGDIRVACNGSRNANVAGPVGSTNPASAPALLPSAGAEAFGVVDRVNSSGLSQYYRLDGVAGDLEIHALSYSLYSPVRVRLALFDSVGNPVDAEVAHPVYEGDSGFRNFDSGLVAPDLPPGNYILQVQANYLASSWYPAGSLAMDFAPFVLITGRVNGSAPAFGSRLPVNARCALDEDFPHYRSPSGGPVRSSNDEVGFCGTVQARMNRPGGGTSTPAAIGWCIPWLLMGAGAYANKLTERLRRRRAAACAPR